MTDSKSDDKHKLISEIGKVLNDNVTVYDDGTEAALKEHRKLLQRAYDALTPGDFAIPYSVTIKITSEGSDWNDVIHRLKYVLAVAMTGPTELNKLGGGGDGGGYSCSVRRKSDPPEDK